MKNYIALLCLCLLLVTSSCKKEEGEVATTATSSLKAISAFSFTTANNTALSADITGTVADSVITTDAPAGTDVTALIANFTTDGANVTVGTTTQISGTTANDFTSGVTYRVTAIDGTTHDYTVSVTVAATTTTASTTSSSNDFSTFTFESANNTALSADVTGTISGTNITATVPYGTTVTALVPTFTHTGDTVDISNTTQTSGSTANDFSSSVTYTVNAEDATTQDYTVTVSVTPQVNGTASSELSLSGTVSILAGSGASGYVDDTGTAAQFSAPFEMVYVGGSLFVADYSNNRIREVVVSTGVVTTLAGDGTAASTDGTGTGAQFKSPFGITTDGTNLYVVDRGSYKIRQVVISTGVVTTIAGNGTNVHLDGTGTAAQFLYPQGIVYDSGNLYVVDQTRIRKMVLSTGVVTTFAGDGTNANLDGNGTAAQFKNAVAITATGDNLFVSENYGYALRQIAISTQEVTTLAGTGSTGNVDSSGGTPTFGEPCQLTTDGTNVYMSDYGNASIRKIVISSGYVTTVTSAVSNIFGMATDGTSLFVTESTLHRIQQID